MLNGTALAFLHQTDELFYDTFVDIRCKHFIERLDSIRIPRFPSRIWSTGILVVVYTFIVGLAVRQHADNLVSIKEDICKGNVDFAYFWHHELNMIFSSRTRSYSEPVHQQVVADLIRFKPALSKVLPTASKLVEYQAYSSMDLAAAEVTNCADMTIATHGTYFRALQKQVGTDSSSCSALKNHCSDASVALVRMLCPVTCKCGHAFPFVAPLSGCPYHCHYNILHSAYYAEDVPCTEVEYSKWSDDVRSTWTSYWDSYVNFTHSEAFKLFVGDVQELSAKKSAQHRDIATTLVVRL